MLIAYHSTSLKNLEVKYTIAQGFKIVKREQKLPVKKAYHWSCSHTSCSVHKFKERARY